MVKGETLHSAVQFVDEGPTQVLIPCHLVKRRNNIGKREQSRRSDISANAHVDQTQVQMHKRGSSL